MLTLSIYTSYRDHFTIVLLLFGILEIKKFFFCAVPSPLVVLRVYFCWKRETFFWNVQHTGKSFFAIPKRDNTNFLLVNFTNFHGKNGTGNVMNTIFFFFLLVLRSLPSETCQQRRLKRFTQNHHSTTPFPFSSFYFLIWISCMKNGNVYLFSMHLRHSPFLLSPNGKIEMNFSPFFLCVCVPILRLCLKHQSCKP